MRRIALALVGLLLWIGVAAAQDPDLHYRLVNARQRVLLHHGGRTVIHAGIEASVLGGCPGGFLVRWDQALVLRADGALLILGLVRDCLPFAHPVEAVTVGR